MKHSELLSVAHIGAAAQFDWQLEALKKLTAIDCGSRDLEGNAKVVAIMDELLGMIDGIKIEHHFSEGYGTHIIARLKPENPEKKIILCGHTDTVFNPGDAAAHPFHVEGDTAYGLGIVDCKGGLLVAIGAVKALQERGLLPNYEIVFIFNCDEEIGSPSGHGVFDLEIPGADMAFVFEPSRLENGVITARKAACRITIDVRGKKAHAGVNYLDGRSATAELAHKILALYKENIDERGLQFNVGPLYGGDSGVGVVSDHATAKVGVRVANQADVDTVREIVARVEKNTFIEGTSTTISVDSVGTPMERNERNVALYQKVNAAAHLLGYDLPEQATGGGSDASYFSAKGVASVDGLGPYMYKMHAMDESMRLSSVTEKTELFAVVLGTLE